MQKHKMKKERRRDRECVCMCKHVKIKSNRFYPVHESISLHGMHLTSPVSSVRRAGRDDIPSRRRLPIHHSVRIARSRAIFLLMGLHKTRTRKVKDIVIAVAIVGKVTVSFFVGRCGCLCAEAVNRRRCVGRRSV